MTDKGPIEAETLVAWRCLLCAPLLFTFQRTIILSPALVQDPLSVMENPALFFAGYLAASLLVCLACAWPQGRRRVEGVGFAAVLLVLVLGTLTIHLLLSFGAPALRVLAGVCTGFASTTIFLKWCRVLARLQTATLVRTVAVANALAYAMTLVSLLFSWSVEGSLTASLIAVFVSALPLEALQGDEQTAGGTAGGAAGAGAASNLRSALHGWWPYLATAFVVYAIVGFSWGNALFGEFAFLEDRRTWLSPAGSCLGALAILVGTKRRVTDGEVPRWPLPVSVGTLVSCWLLLVTFGREVMWLTLPLTGMAFGMIDALLMAWACATPRLRGADPLVTGSLGRAASLIPMALGIVLSPLLKGDAVTLVSPLAGVVFFIVYRLDETASRISTDTAAEAQATSDDGSHLEALAATAGLSPREHEVFLLLACGYSSGYMADQLGVSAYTVKTHVKHIYSKLGVHTKDEFLTLVAQEGSVQA